MAALSEKIAECKRMVSALPGGDKESDEQMEKLELEMKRHKRKRYHCHPEKTLITNDSRHAMSAETYLLSTKT